MKQLTTIIVLIFLVVFVKAQNVKKLDKVNTMDTIPTKGAIFYGNFIQRLGFSSGGFPQEIRLINLDTEEIFAFRVKPTFKSSKENIFIYFIKPGKYAILNYYWTKSKWYGGTMFTEPIFKNIDATDGFEQKIKAGEIKIDELKQFTFTITENSLNYLGNWNFEKGLVSFVNNKTAFDNLLKNKYKKLDFSKATIELPN